MSIEYSTEKKMKKLLIVTSSGGGGLIQTANAKAQEALARDPGLQIVRRDLLVDWIWKPMGRFFINSWNKAQRRGNVSAQSFFVWGQFLVDIFLHPTIFVYALYTLFTEDVDHVIDTQVFGTSAILKALRIYNWRRGKSVHLEKILVDLPTKKATHFFRPIKNLSKRNRKLIQLTSIAPLLDDGETNDDFWQSTCGFSAREVNIEEVYVRQAFRQYKGKSRPVDSMRISVATKNEEEVYLMKKTFQRGSIQSKVKANRIEFLIEPTDRMITVLLGSQPSGEATINYVKKFASFAKQFPETTTHLFVFCADHQEGKETLFRKVVDAASSIKDYPKKLSIIPFSFQTEEVIAPLFYRSDITCTRSGGQTAMELMCVSTGEIWVHSEARKGEAVLNGIPGWEAASAVYLQKMRGAKILTPEMITPYAQQVFQTSIGQGQASRPLESTA
jgi:hypothetical protein